MMLSIRIKNKKNDATVVLFLNNTEEPENADTIAYYN